MVSMSSTIAWMGAIISIAIIVMGVFSLVLNWILPIPSEPIAEKSVIEVRDAQMKRNLFLGIVGALALLAAATTFYNQTDMAF